MNQQFFDKLVRDKLAALEVEQDANSWDMFTQKLDDSEEVTSTVVSVDVFDQIFQEKIGDISITDVNSSWDAFEQKLTGEEAGIPDVNETVLDEVVYNKLHNYQVPYDAATWKILLTRLRAETWQKIEISVYKLAELALVLLLFLFGQQFISEPKLESLPISTLSKNAIAQYEDSQVQDDYLVETTTIDEVDEVALSNTLQSEVKESSPAQKKTGHASTTLLEESTNQLLKPKDEQLSIATSDMSDAQKEESARVDNNEDLSLNSQQLERLTPVKEIIGNNRSEERLSALETEISEVEQEEEQELVDVNLLKPVKKNAWRVGMFGASMIDHITTPRDHVFKIDGYDRYSLGYGGGFSIGKQLLNNKWEIESGLMYIAKRYPQQVVLHIFNGNVKDGYGVTWVSDIEMNIVNIPLNIRYNIIDNNKWKVYGLGGASLQLILQANYDSDEESLRFSAAPPSGESKSTRATESESELYQRKRFNNGFLVDGNFKENRYFNYNIGIGLERFVSPRWSVFAQPTYQHTIKAFNNDGIGPNRDRINTMLILLGAKVGL